MNYLKLDPDYDGSCPCSVFMHDGMNVHVHCWKTQHDNCDCKYSGIHVYGDNPKALISLSKEILEYVQFAWPNTEWEVVHHVT